jgi:uncharacterized RDD family membrane protein YckC
VSELPSYPQEAAEREQAGAPERADIQLASWGRRFVAYVVDLVIVLLLMTAAFLIPYLIVLAVPFSDEDENDALYVVLVALIILAVVVALLVAPVYYTILTGKRGQTWGKRWLGIRVLSDGTGGPIGYGRALGRYLITVVFGFFLVPLFIDYLWPLWDGKNQTLHDKVVSSLVVRV